MLATAFQVLHFQQFLAEQGPLPDVLATKLALLQENPSSEAMADLETCEHYLQFMQRYIEHTEVSLSGGHGSTARFWMLYVKLIHLYMMLIRACKISSLELLTYILGEMRYVFFACSRPNYARWMVKYFFNLANIDTAHPGLRKVLENGALSIRRTDKTFSRTPVDLTLEQTINADAASRLTGISASKELKPYRIQKDNADLTRLQDCIKWRMNPFELEPDKNLYCLTTGKNVPDDIKQDLLHCTEIGKQWCEDFVDGCFADAARFEKPIPRRKIKNFTSAAVKTTVRKDMKLIEVQGTRDLFGRLFCLSTEHNIYLEKVFSYPLAPVPLSLAHVDGSINKTDNAKLLHKVEKMIADHNSPTTLDITIVDAMFFFHTLLNLPRTYGELAELILSKLCKMSPRVDLVFDTYCTPSVKDVEHGRRSADDCMYTITGPEQKRPQDWQKALRSAAFKTAFFRFLLDEWTRHADLLY